LIADRKSEINASFMLSILLFSIILAYHYNLTLSRAPVFMPFKYVGSGDFGGGTTSGTVVYLA
jgi:hypothetical protein